MSAREAMRTLVQLGVSPRLDGDGIVMSQTPEAGAPFERGRRVPAGARSSAEQSRSEQHDATMSWSELHAALSAHGLLRSDPPKDAARLEAPVTGIAYDSRRVAPGNVFVGLQGLHADGAAFGRQALDRGALMVVSDRAGAGRLRTIDGCR